MYRFIRDHNKKFMAVFAVVLMVAFLLPAGFQQMGNRRADAARSHMGDQPITYGDYQRAENDWELLARDAFTITSFGQQVPLLITLGDPAPQRLAMMMRMVDERMFPNAPLAPIQIVGNPTTFLLLLKEAQAAGITISDARVDETLRSEVTIRPDLDARLKQNVREAVRDFLAVEASYARVASAVKASEPMRQRTLAERLVRITADVVAFDAAPAAIPALAAAATTAPSDEALKAQFDKYADVASGAVTDTNPFGFGYLIPDRAKVQTLGITRDQLKAAVEKTRKPRQWDVDARKYFYSNPTEFPAPTSQPATTLPGAAAGFDINATPAGPTTAKVRTFDDLTAEQKKDAVARVMRPEIEALESKINAYLTDRFTKDYATAKPSTQPATAPSEATGYTSYGYLEGVAADVQKQFGVLPTTADHTSWLDGPGMNLLPGISSANLASGAGFGVAVFTAQPFNDSEKASPRLQEFSQALRDFNENIYYFRLTAAERRHKPASLDEVRAQVVADVARQAANDAATTAAKALVTAATTSGFGSAATAAGQKVVTVGPLDLQNAFAPVIGLDVPEADRRAFARGIAQALSSTTRDPAGRPLGTVSLPTARKVLAINITAAPLETIPGSTTFSDQLAAAIMTENQLDSVILTDWFSFDGVSKRIHYKGDKPDQAGM